MNKSVKPTQIIELIFDALYLLTVASIGVVLLGNSKNQAVMLWGVMSLALAVGDSFHLIPRMAAIISQDKNRHQKALGFGKMLTSITMTVFYVFLWHAALLLFSLELPVATSIIYVLAIFRVILCVMPQNKWLDESPPTKWNIYRNIPFVIIGVMVTLIYALNSSVVPTLKFMWLAIFLSFAFYIPVVLFSNKNPKLGMLMLPKSCAYVWIVSMGISLISL